MDAAAGQAAAVNQGAMRSQGFTLVEVIVSLTLVALIMLALVSALASFGDSGSRLEQRALKSDDLKLVHGLLRQSLSAAAPHQHVRASDQVATVWLKGERAGMEWLGLMPARHGAGGLYHMRLRVDRSFDQDVLFLDYHPYLGAQHVLDWSQAVSHQLMAGQLEVEFAYMRAGASEWLATWEDPVVLPGYVRFSVTRDGDRWPDLIVRLLAAEKGVDIAAQPQIGARQ